MQVAIAYGAVVLIWATTPLTIQWSNSSLSFNTAITVRMLAASLLSYAILKLMRRPLVTTNAALESYIAGAVGLFPNMLVVYWSAQYIPSGLMSVILGFLPFSVGIFSWLLNKDNIFTPQKILALLFAITGLVVINLDQLALEKNAMFGVLGMCFCSLVWGLSVVWVKKANANLDPIQQNTGTLLFCTPFFILSWFLFDGQLPTSIDIHSLVGVSYLVIVGSLLGHTLYFYVLNHCSVVVISLVPLITPILALAIGHHVQGENFSASALIGAGLIILSLTVYQGLHNTLISWTLQMFNRRKARIFREC